MPYLTERRPLTFDSPAFFTDKRWAFCVFLNRKAVVLSSHSTHNDERRDSEARAQHPPSPGASAINRQSAALLALGSDQKRQEEYLRSKTFSYNDLPDWLRSECFHLARPFYESHVTNILINSLYATAVKLTDERVMRARKFLGALRTKGSCSAPLFKKPLIREIENAGPFILTQDVFDQLGLARASNLYDLLKMSKVDISDYRTPEPLEKKIEGALTRSKFCMVQVAPIMPPFSPVAGPFAKHATEAYDTAAGRIIAFHLASDIVASYQLPLGQEHIQKIVHEVTDNPFEDLRASPRLQLLITYAEHYERHPTCTSIISRDEALKLFAFNRRPLSDLNAEETYLHQREREREEAKRHPSEPTSPQAPLPPPPPIIDEHREVILRCAQLDRSENAIVHLQRAARFYDVTPRELEKLLRLHVGDVDATITALKISSQPNDPLEDAPQSEISSKSEPSLQPFAFISHKAEHGFTKWFTGLSDDQQTRVRESLKNVARRCRGITKPVKGDHYRGLYEIRVMDCQLRIYFRFIPGMRIVLLTGGDKGDSRTGQQLDLDRAARYRDEYNHCTVDTDLSDSMFHP